MFKLRPELLLQVILGIIYLGLQTIGVPLRRLWRLRRALRSIDIFLVLTNLLQAGRSASSRLMLKLVWQHRVLQGLVALMHVNPRATNLVQSIDTEW
jgi:hypothetical protein